MGRRYVVIKHPRCSAAAVLLSVCFVFLEKEILAHWDPRSRLFLVTSLSFPRPLALFCMNHRKLDIC